MDCVLYFLAEKWLIKKKMGPAALRCCCWNEILEEVKCRLKKTRFSSLVPIALTAEMF